MDIAATEDVHLDTTFPMLVLKKSCCKLHGNYNICRSQLWCGESAYFQVSLETMMYE